MKRKSPPKSAKRAKDTAKRKQTHAEFLLSRKQAFAKQKEKVAELKLARQKAIDERRAEKKRLVAARENEICDYFINNDFSLETVGQKFGITRERVRQILKANGIDNRRKWKVARCKYIAEIQDSAAADFHNGMSRQDVLVKYGLNEYEWKTIPHDPLVARLARFWARIEKGEHWLYKGKLDIAGYPRTNVLKAGRSAEVYRATWKLENGKDPENWLTNTCGLKLCVNPDHWADLPPKEALRNRRPARALLSQKAVQEILESSLSRTELMAKYDRSYYTIVAVQKGNYGRRVTDEQIREVLALKGTMSPAKISRQVSVGMVSVGRILRGHIIQDPDGYLTVV